MKKATEDSLQKASRFNKAMAGCTAKLVPNRMGSTGGKSSDQMTGAHAKKTKGGGKKMELPKYKLHKNDGK